MDKYQIEMLKGVTFELTSESGNGSACIKDDVMVLTQNRNYNIIDYVLHVNGDAIESIEVYTKSWVKSVDKGINVSFNEDITKIRLNFALVDPIEFNVTMVKADKKAYDDVQLQALKDSYIKNSNAILIKNIFGPNYVVFNPCGDAYAYTEVEFIARNNKGTTELVFPRQYAVGCGTHTNNIKEVRVILERKRNEKGCNYVEFGNIGECGLIAHIYQYDKDDNLLIDYEIM